MNHKTVLKEEAVAALALAPESVVIDATYGAGGHAELICSQLSKKGMYVGIDADKTAFAGSFLLEKKGGPKFHLVNDNFSNVAVISEKLKLPPVDAILADLGWRTDQFESGGKGFSFSSNDPLTMTYGDGEQYLFTANDIVNGWQEEDIANVIYGYGEERYSRRIAHAIVTARRIAPIATAKALADIVAQAVPASYRSGKTNPATKTFQALRIAVNDELKALETFLETAPRLLKPGGVLAIISFHSIEDRQVKLAFRAYRETHSFELLTKKPITAGVEELQKNPRARSAKLRVLRKIT